MFKYIVYQSFYAIKFIIFNAIQKQLADKTTNFIALTGGAGTGKTLLTYHIAKKAMER